MFLSAAAMALRRIVFIRVPVIGFDCIELDLLTLLDSQGGYFLHLPGHLSDFFALDPIFGGSYVQLGLVGFPLELD